MKDRVPRRRILIGAVDILNDEYIRFTNEDMSSFDDMINVVMSSTAVPIAFPFRLF